MSGMRPLAIVISTVVVLLASACGDRTEEKEKAEPDSAEATWKSLRLPHLETRNREAWLLYAGTEHRLPRGELDGVVTLTSTADAALVQVSGQSTAPGELWRLTPDGDWDRIGERVDSVVIADGAGHLAAWTERRAHDSVLVAYDTARDAPVAEAGLPTDAMVTEVQGGDVWLSGFHHFGETWQWRPGEGLPRAHPREGNGSAMLVQAAAAEGSRAGLTRQDGSDWDLALEDGEGTVLRRFTDAVAIGFSPDGRHLAVASDDAGISVVAGATGETEADVSVQRSEYEPIEAEWGRDGNLLVTVSRETADYEEKRLRLYTCGAPDWSCQAFDSIDGYVFWPRLPSTFAGQFMLAYEKEGESCEDC